MFPSFNFLTLAILTGALATSLPRDEKADYHDAVARARTHAESHEVIRNHIARVNPANSAVSDQVASVFGFDTYVESPEEEAERRAAEQAYIEKLRKRWYRYLESGSSSGATNAAVSEQVEEAETIQLESVPAVESAAANATVEAPAVEDSSAVINLETDGAAFVVTPSDLASGDWVVVTLPDSTMNICLEKDNVGKYSPEQFQSFNVVGVLFDGQGNAIPVCRPGPDAEVTSKVEAVAVEAPAESAAPVVSSEDDLLPVVAFVDSIPGMEEFANAPEVVKVEAVESKPVDAVASTAPTAPATDLAGVPPPIKTLEDGLAALTALIASKTTASAATDAPKEAKEAPQPQETPATSEAAPATCPVVPSSQPQQDEPVVAAPEGVPQPVVAETVQVCPVVIVDEKPAEEPHQVTEEVVVAAPVVVLAEEPEASVEEEEPKKVFRFDGHGHVLGPQEPPKRKGGFSLFGRSEGTGQFAHHFEPVAAPAAPAAPAAQKSEETQEKSVPETQAPTASIAPVAEPEAKVAVAAAVAAAQQAAISASLAEELDEEREQDLTLDTDVKEVDERSLVDQVSSSTSNLRIFGGNGNQVLAAEVCSALNLQLGRADVAQYADGEVAVQVQENVRGKDCYVIQSLCGPNPNNQLMELLLLVSTLRRASANRITAVIPYFAYARQLDANTVNRPNIAAADIAIMLETMGVDQVITVDLHRPEVVGFFEKTPVENLDTQSAAIPYLLDSKDLRSRPTAVVAPIGNTVKRAVKFRNALAREGVDVSMCFSYPTKQGRGVGHDDQHHSDLSTSADKIEILGNVKGRDAIIVDDMIDSASRVCSVSGALKSQGAKRVFAYATHGLFTGDALKRIEDSPLKEVVVFNTVPVPANKRVTSRVRQLSAAPLIAETIRRINENKGTSDLVHNIAEYS